jgi:hypothetical protein
MICFGLWPKRSLSRKQLTNNITLAIPYIAKERTVLKSFTTLAFSYKKNDMERCSSLHLETRIWLHIKLNIIAYLNHQSILDQVYNIRAST